MKTKPKERSPRAIQFRLGAAFAMSLNRPSKQFFALLFVGVGLVTFSTLAYWLWSKQMEPASPDWPKMWKEVKAKVGNLTRPLKLSARKTQCLAELNRFAAIANLKQIKSGDVITAGDEDEWFEIETKTHTVTFLTNSLGQARIHRLTEQGINIMHLPPVWKEPAGKWGEEEAVAETLRIVKDLGPRFTVGRHSVHAQEVPNAQGVKMKRFYHVTLLDTNGIVGAGATFCVGETGTGRLIAWGVTNPEEW